MTIRCEQIVELPVPPERPFALLDDLEQTPRWLSACTSLERLDEGASLVGARLRFSYREGAHHGHMDGVLLARAPGERITCRYANHMMEVTVDFELTRTPGGTRLRHVIEVTPKTLVAKLLAPLIRRRLLKQMSEAMEALRALV